VSLSGQLGLSTYAFTSPDILIYSFVPNGTWRLGCLEIPTRIARDYPMEFSSLSGVHASATTVVLRCATMTSPPAIATVDVNTGAVSPIKLLVPSDSLQNSKLRFRRRNRSNFRLATATSPTPFIIVRTIRTGRRQLRKGPPLLVKSHGGPTTATDSALNFSVQFWTSRGFGVLDVNYRGKHRVWKGIPGKALRSVGCY